MDLKARVGPLEHALGLVFLEEATAHEEPEDRAAERFGQGGGVMGGPPRPAHEGPLGPEAALGDDEVEMGMPVGQRTMGLEAGDDADLQVRFPGGGADGGGHAAGRDPGEIAEQGAPVQAGGPEPFRQGEDHLPVRHRCEQRRVEPQAPPGQPRGVIARPDNV
jgi:hypothetical protein